MSSDSPDVHGNRLKGLFRRLADALAGPATGVSASYDISPRIPPKGPSGVARPPAAKPADAKL